MELGFKFDPQTASTFGHRCILLKVTIKFSVIELLAVPFDVPGTPYLHKIAITKTGGIINRNARATFVAGGQCQHDRAYEDDPHRSIL